MSIWGDAAAVAAITGTVMMGPVAYIYGLPATSADVTVPVTEAHPHITEDDPLWDCRIDGNRVCGPANVQGVTAGCYGPTGDLVTVWPCRPEVSEISYRP
ncbi:hypothetical protein CL96_gp122 [Mycobacterium phage Firecracker]|uniref:Uncharacterized protein n=1 Tax=Mycobacterium phage Firecracker TaxID=2922998 RepID=G8I4A4_9CAUD|nr:hypothetical protein CL96_gp122 [Mycobacterium phage Firecracker]AER47548.1 hypothetical protein FIRECRACKER_122 [Mycobacterium phage Firecracker]